MRLQLYLVCGESPDGECLDWFVVASGKERAVQLWREIEFVKDIGEGEKPGQVHVIEAFNPKWTKEGALSWSNKVGSQYE